MKSSIFAVAVALFCVACGQKSNSLHAAKINGRINVLSEEKDYWLLEIDKQRYKFVATPLFDNEFSFRDIVKLGDTIVKMPNTDTLYMQKQEIRFGYIVKAL